MNREIKFRGKVKYNGNHKFNGEWIYGYYRNNDIGNAFITETLDEIENYIFEETEVEEETVGQYTGLNDKNGKEIYEGDIVKAVVIKQNRKTEDEVEEKIMPVVSEKGEFLLKDNTTNLGPTFHHLRLCKSIKLIGNITDNPELLEA